MTLLLAAERAGILGRACELVDDVLVEATDQISTGAAQIRAIWSKWNADGGQGAGAMNQEEYASRRALVADEIAWAKVHLSLEDYLDTEFSLLRVTPHITHLKQEERCFYSVITVASPEYALYADIYTVLNTIYLEGAIACIYGSDLDRLLVERFAEIGCGVSPCHAADNFSRKRGRIIAKGRLFKVLRKARLER